VAASLASVAAGCALILPLGGGQPLAVVSQRAAASDAAEFAATGTLTPSGPTTPGHILTTSDTSTPSADATPLVTAVAAAVTPADSTTDSSTPKPTASASKTTAASVSSAAEHVVAYARAHLGYPYRVGTMGPDYYDCAGLVAAAYRSAGYVMPFSEAKESTGGTPVALKDLQPGDVVVWGSPVHSVSIYAGDGVIIIADGPDYGIRTVTLSARLQWDTFAGGRRYIG